MIFAFKTKRGISKSIENKDMSSKIKPCDHELTKNHQYKIQFFAQIISEVSDDFQVQYKLRQ